VYQESYEFRKNEGVEECQECGKEFFYERITTIKYSTEKIETGNNVVVNARCKNCEIASACILDLADVAYCTNWAPMSPDPNKEGKGK
jgi:hypothetical protein